MSPKVRTFSLALTVVILALSLAPGCTDREAAGREQTEAKVRAAAARQEMEQLPKAFKSPPMFKRNEPEKKSEPAPHSTTRR